MKRLKQLRHEFVEFIPDHLEQGVIYISIPYATTTHLCACGCGHEVVNPLAPHGWQLTFDGRTVSLSPSIGNWSYACVSHYWIRHDRVDWVGAWRRDQVDAGRARRREEIEHDVSTSRPVAASAGWMDRLRRLLRRR